MNKINNKTEQEIKEFLLEVEKNERSDYQYSLEVYKQVSKVIKKIEKLTSKDLSKNYMEIIIFLNRLSFSNFCKIHAYIDHNFPGISFHYVMETRQEVINYLQNQNYTRYGSELMNEEIVNECEVYLSRLKILQVNNMLNLIMSPMRTRLATGLLTDTLEHPANTILSVKPNKITNEPTILEEKDLLLILKKLTDLGEEEEQQLYSTEV